MPTVPTSDSCHTARWKWELSRNVTPVAAYPDKRELHTYHMQGAGHNAKMAHNIRPCLHILQPSRNHCIHYSKRVTAEHQRAPL